MDKRRREAERRILDERIGTNLYRFQNEGTESECIVFGARTNRGNVYTLRVELADFPDEIPAAFVMRMLKDKDGEDLDGISADMHTLESENGCTRICHHGPKSWTPRISLYKVYVKCRLWLEMYELHLQTGKPLDYYLNHQQ